MDGISSIADLVDSHLLAHVARPPNLRLGQKIQDQSGVEFVQFGPLRGSAKVGGVLASAQRWTVELSSGPAGLEWACTCAKRKNLLCKHCVAQTAGAVKAARKRRLGPAQTGIWKFAEADIAKQSIAAFLNTLPWVCAHQLCLRFLRIY
jgi:hypothetical protein